MIMIVKVTKFKAHISFFERKKLLMKKTLLCATNLTHRHSLWLCRVCSCNLLPF